VIPSLLVWRATRIARGSARERRQRLEAQLSTCLTRADQLDLLATLDRYPDAQTEELRSMITDAAARSARPPAPLHLRRPLTR
jgi:hypothetical protein